MATAGDEDPDEWELVNDDGFVYRRKKRRRLESTTAAAASPAPPQLDPEVERRNRVQRRKRVLLKLRDKYRTEISHWELLSNTLREMERRASLPRELNSSIEYRGFVEEQHALDRPQRSVIDDLLIQVETQEAVIKDASRLCDVAETLCNAHEERRKQQLLNLPIWDPSPQELLSVLAEP